MIYTCIQFIVFGNKLGLIKYTIFFLQWLKSQLRSMVKYAIYHMFIYVFQFVLNLG